MSLWNPCHHLHFTELEFRKVTHSLAKGMPASELRELGSDLRSLSHEAIFNPWALLLNVLQVPQFLPATPCWLSHWQRVMKCPNWVRPVILTLGALDPQRSIRAVTGHLMLFSTLQKYLMCAMCFLVINLLTLAQSISLCLDESKHLHSFGYLNVQWMTPVSSLWACWLFPWSRRLDWHFLCFDSQKWTKVLR